MADTAPITETGKALAQISAQLASSKDGGYLQAIATKLNAKSGSAQNDPFAGFKIPQLTDIAKGLTFGLAPGLIKKSVAGMQIFMESLNAMDIDDVEKSSKIIQLVDGYSTAIRNFGEIPWMKAFKGTFLLEKFTDRFKKIGAVLGSRENINALIPFKNFAMSFGIPLKLIGTALSSFAKIQWTSVFISTIFLNKIMSSLAKMGNTFGQNQGTFEKMGEIMEKFTTPLEQFITAFNNMKFVKMFIGVKVLEKIIAPLVNVAKGISKNKKILERFGATLNVFATPLKKFVTAFNNMKFVKMFIGVKVLEKIIQPLVNVAKAVSKNKQTFERFGETLSKITEPLKVFGETFDKIGNALLKASVSLLIVSGSLVLAAFGLKQIGEINLEQAVAGIVTLGVMVGAVYGLSKIAEKAIKGAAALAIVAGSLGLAALSLKLFAGIEWPALGKAGAALGGLVTALALIGVIMMGPLGAGLLTGVAALAIVGLAMIPFAAGMAILGAVNWKGFDGILGAIASLAAGLFLLSVGVPALVLSAIAIIPFALGMAILSAVNWDSITKSGAALTALGEGVGNISFFALAKAALGIIPFAASIVALRLAVGKDNKISTFLEKFNKGLKDLKGESLLLAAKGILALSGALVAFAGAQVVAGIGNLVGKILRFGGDGPIEQLIKLAKHGYNLSILGTGVKDLAAGLKTLTGIDSELDILDNLADRFKGFDALDPTGIKAFAEGLNVLVTALTALSQLDGKLSVLDQIPFDKLKSLSESIKPGAPLIQIVNGLKESEQSKETSMLLQKGIQSNAPTVGAQLRESGSSMNSSTIIVNNNNGGNVTNNSSSSSNVNNNGSVNTPIITASGSGMFIAE